MKIDEITIEHCKGIDSLCITSPIEANKTNILVASNGTGKTSFAVAFDSLNRDRLKLEKINFHKNDATLKPKIIVKINNLMLSADMNKNEISKEIEISVIKSRIKAKTKGGFPGTYIQPIADIITDDILVMKKSGTKLNLNTTEFCKKLNINIKNVYNCKELLNDELLWERISNASEELKELKKAKFVKEMNDIAQNKNITDVMQKSNLVKSKFDKLNNTFGFNENKYKKILTICLLHIHYNDGIKNHTVYCISQLNHERLKSIHKSLNQTWSKVDLVCNNKTDV